MIATIIRIFFRGKIVLMERLRGLSMTMFIRLSGGRCGSGLRVGRGVKIKYGPHAGFSFGKNVYLGDFCVLDIPPKAKLSMGSNSYLSVGVFLAANESVILGDYALVAEYCSIRDHDHGIALGDYVFNQENVISPVRLGNDVWVGRGVAVLRGADIEDKAIVGANSVVKGKVPFGTIVAGVPAREIKKR